MRLNSFCLDFRCLWILILLHLSEITSTPIPSFPLSSLSSMKYPEFRVSPNTFLNEERMITLRNEFAITAFTVDNQQDHLWWRWYMPSFAEKHLHGLNLTVKQHHHINQKFLCHLRMIGMISGSHVSYDPSGYGLLDIPLLATPIRHLECYYIFTHKTPRVAIYCPILNSTNVTQTQYSLSEAQEMCSQFLSSKDKFILNVTLFPSIYRPPTPPSSPQSLHATATIFKKEVSLMSSVITIREQERKEFPSLPTVKSPHHSSHRIAFTAQVFCNTVSEAHLHIFLQHYGRLDFTIVMFDRFGLHYGIVKQYTHLYDIRYHPYTLLQVIQPQLYTDTYKTHLVLLTPFHSYLTRSLSQE